jgi:hypothetical protein
VALRQKDEQENTTNIKKNSGAYRVIGTFPHADHADTEMFVNVAADMVYRAFLDFEQLQKQE